MEEDLSQKLCPALYLSRAGNLSGFYAWAVLSRDLFPGCGPGKVA